MGGVDTRNLILKITNNILNNFELDIVIVTSNANSNIDKIKDRIKGNKRIKLIINTNKIASLINNSRLVITTPSVTLNEVMYLNTPFIAIQNADNQNFMIEYLKENQLPHLTSYSDIYLIKEIRRILI